MIAINNLDSALVLCVLHGASWCLSPKQKGITKEQARKILDTGVSYFDYLQGRVMKVGLHWGATSFDGRLYDRDNGAGAAQKAVDYLCLYLKTNGAPPPDWAISNEDIESFQLTGERT